MTLQQVIDAGFDRSEKNGKSIRVKCSQCDAVVINGTPCHEHGCPNGRALKHFEDEDE